MLNGFPNSLFQPLSYDRSFTDEKQVSKPEAKVQNSELKIVTGGQSRVSQVHFEAHRSWMCITSRTTKADG